MRFQTLCKLHCVEEPQTKSICLCKVYESKSKHVQKSVHTTEMNVIAFARRIPNVERSVQDSSWLF